MRCAVVVASVRAEPSDGAEQVTQLLRGEPVALQEVAGGWARIRTGYDYPGWVREAALESGDGAFMVDRSASAPLDVAKEYLGSPYEWGGLTERGIDCSGLVHISYRRAGRLVQRDAAEQETGGEPVEVTQAGDLVTYGAGVADHIAFWLGDGRILHSTGRDGLGVVEEGEPAALQVARRKFVRFAAIRERGIAFPRSG